MNASIETQNGLKTLSGAPADAKYYNNAGTPYADVAEVMAQIPEALRGQGLTVLVAGVEYWWATADKTINPVVKTGDIATQAEAEAGTNTTKLMTPERVKQAITAITHSYTLDFQTSVTILQDINLEGSIQITEIHKNNVATLLLGVTDVATLTLPYTITNNTLLAWTITRTIAGMASVGIKYIKI